MTPILMFAGYGLVIVGGLMMLIEAFRESVLWGLACLFVPIVSLFFLIVHWDVAKKGFMLQLLGLALLVVGMLVFPDSHRAGR